MAPDAPNPALPDQSGNPVSVTVGILTYERPASLVRTLRSVIAGPHSFVGPCYGWALNCILVIDNDPLKTAQGAVAGLTTIPDEIPVRYVHEPTRGLAAARNRALDETTTDVLIFIDDDEEAAEGWPDGLIRVMASTGAALVGGPVNTSFGHEPPAWTRSGALFDRSNPPDESDLDWLRSGNLALDMERINDHGLRFDPGFSFTGGEDVAFSRQAKRAGLGLRWSATAPVTEHVGPERTTIRWVTRRERTSTANWVRVELASEPTISRRLLIAARGSVRLAQGVVTVLAGLGTLQSGRAVKGLVLASRGLGSFQGLFNRANQAYGKDALRT
ncbi:MAG: glycosyltransferase family 2 protein [Actinomycetia bacterium]|nr:glycosyltransferase family 2 protein [Actinomycetes bacterium]MCP4227105.1 glycosyltransferase family 2 protein [Actinomycetes bacterium]MCP5030371.1 glycosyltransferase family 2 protein [Actinomycetes bacterium]